MHVQPVRVWVDKVQFGRTLLAAMEPDDLQQLERKLRDERDAIVARSRRRAREALGESARLPDEADQASLDHDAAFELRLADKDRKLLKLIEHALSKLPTGEYGLCEGTGEPIALPRLKARPWARYSVAYKEQLELERSLHVDD